MCPSARASSHLPGCRLEHSTDIRASFSSRTAGAALAIRTTEAAAAQCPEQNIFPDKLRPDRSPALAVTCPAAINPDRRVIGSAGGDAPEPPHRVSSGAALLEGRT